MLRRVAWRFCAATATPADAAPVLATPLAQMATGTPLPRRVVVLDLETTGLKPHRGDSILEVFAMELVDREATGEVFHSFVGLGPGETERRVSSTEGEEMARRVHGITEEQLKDAPPIGTVMRKLLAFLEHGRAPIVGHVVSMDVAFIEAEAARLKLRWRAPLAWHCTNLHGARLVGAAAAAKAKAADKEDSKDSGAAAGAGGAPPADGGAPNSATAAAASAATRIDAEMAALEALNPRTTERAVAHRYVGLRRLCDFTGIPFDPAQAHGAEYDARRTCDAFLRLTAPPHNVPAEVNNDDPQKAVLRVRSMTARTAEEKRQRAEAALLEDDTVLARSRENLTDALVARMERDKAKRARRSAARGQRRADALIDGQARQHLAHHDMRTGSGAHWEQTRGDANTLWHASHSPGATLGYAPAEGSSAAGANLADDGSMEVSGSAAKRSPTTPSSVAALWTDAQKADFAAKVVLLLTEMERNDHFAPHLSTLRRALAARWPGQVHRSGPSGATMDQFRTVITRAWINAATTGNRAALVRGGQRCIFVTLPQHAKLAATLEQKYVHRPKFDPAPMIDAIATFVADGARPRIECIELLRQRFPALMDDDEHAVMNRRFVFGRGCRVGKFCVAMDFRQPVHAVGRTETEARAYLVAIASSAGLPATTSTSVVSGDEAADGDAAGEAEPAAGLAAGETTEEDEAYAAPLQQRIRLAHRGPLQPNLKVEFDV